MTTLFMSLSQLLNRLTGEKIVDEAITREMEFVFDADIVQQNLRFIEVHSMLNSCYNAGDIFSEEKGSKHGVQ